MIEVRVELMDCAEASARRAMRFLLTRGRGIRKTRLDRPMADLCAETVRQTFGTSILWMVHSTTCCGKCAG